MKRRVITFGDTETTGLNEPEQRIVEIALIQFDLDTEEHIKTWLWRSNPLVKIGPKALKVHGITQAELENEPTYDIIAPAIRGVIEPSVGFVAHNGFHFDFPFIEREQARVGCPVKYPKLFDTMTEARWATGNGKNPKLGELALSLDVPYDPDKGHAADYDTMVMALCFFAGRRIGWFNFTP